MLLNGIRDSVHRHGLAAAEEEGAGMTLSLRASMHIVSDERNVDAGVQEVFETMLSVRCKRAELTQLAVRMTPAESVTAVVGFGGILSGACVLACDDVSARQIARLMTGIEFGSVDDVVKDAIGEICNMLAGAWKSTVPELAANCGLSVPAVITGRDYNLHVQAPEFKLHHAYCFGDAAFEVTIVCDGLL